MYRSLIIEDEEPARNRLKYLLQEHRDDIEVVGEADNGEDGYQLINELKPDLIFLDIQMPVLNGFEMLKKTMAAPQIIFITAYEQFAMRAFEENSIDYILKPIEPERLKKAIEKLKGLSVQSKTALQSMISDMINTMNVSRKIDSLSVKVGNSIRLLKVEEITYLEAKDKYVYAFDLQGNRHLIDLSLVKLIEQLPDHFFQIHRGRIINRNHLLEIRRGFKQRFAFVLKTDQGSKSIVQSGTSYASKIREAFDF